MTGPKLVVMLAGWTLRVDRYGVLIHNTDRFVEDMAKTEPADDEACSCDCDHQDPDGPESVMWVVSPLVVRNWFEQAIDAGREGLDELMTELELQGIGEQ